MRGGTVRDKHNDTMGGVRRSWVCKLAVLFSPTLLEYARVASLAL